MGVLVACKSIYLAGFAYTTYALKWTQFYNIQLLRWTICHPRVIQTPRLGWKIDSRGNVYDIHNRYKLHLWILCLFPKFNSIQCNITVIHHNWGSIPTSRSFKLKIGTLYQNWCVHNSSSNYDYSYSRWEWMNFIVWRAPKTFLYMQTTIVSGVTQRIKELHMMYNETLVTFINVCFSCIWILCQVQTM